MASPKQATSPPADAEASSPSPTSPPRQQRHETPPEGNATEEPADPALPSLFTLVQNSTSKTTHHPHVHYIFADDDPEILTRALAASDPASGGAGPTRSVLLDLAPGDDGWSVSHAASLSADWAVVDASLRKMEDAEGQGEEGTGGLMLKIEGVEGERENLEASQAGAKDGREEFAALAGEFERRMSVLRRVVAAGEARRRASPEEEVEGEEPAKPRESPETGEAEGRPGGEEATAKESKESEENAPATGD